ncbi:hypothetical protein SLS60_009616 [Paraconiothyrium brasiliense]|uniref:Heterokaryon incompatibility domain-containing protein n=1 Tax=Paraconiothyrium brasiliense TaxID=300254 RepID=A0ABR3QUT2_9PLEO
MPVQISSGDVPTASARSSIYRNRLSKDEIRLICIPAAIDQAAPIHLSVEVHPHDRCPEYEALSYTWGGEDNDSSLSHPIYIGPYWDALLQTKNCWEMIRFLRPSRGVRLVWIDAICINQLDVHEKEAQVRKMARIYEECSRVVVFLGSDVSYNEPGQYPYKMKLRDALQPHQKNGKVTNAINVDILSLLHRRYFTRVWVIQELAMSPRMVIQVGNLELLVDFRTPPRRARWDLTPVPWFEHLSQQRLRRRGVYDVLQATWNNKAADIRDKVFGVHALFGDHDSRSALRPDYSLPCFEVFLGVFAHALLCEKRTEILYSAAGISAAGLRPTWLPDWTVSDATQLFRSPPMYRTHHPPVSGTTGDKFWTGEPAYQLIRGLDDRWDPSLLSYDEYQKTLGEDYEWSSLDQQREREWLAQQGPPYRRVTGKNVLHVSTEPRQMNRNDSVHSEHDFYKDVVDYELGTTTWRDSAYVDARTGSLAIDLIHVLQFKTKPRLWGEWGGMKVYRLDAIDGQVAMYLTVQCLALDQIIIPGRDHLFLLWCGSSEPCMYPILRQAGGIQAHEYMLVGVCSHICFEAYMGKYQKEVPVYSKYGKYDLDDGDHGITYEARRRTDKWLFVHDLHYSAKVLLFSVRDLVRNPPGENEQNRLDALFPGVHNQRNMIAVLQALLSELNEPKFDARGGFLSAYVANIDAHFEPRVHEGHVEITIHPANWEEMHRKRFAAAYSKAFKEWRHEGKDKWSSKFKGGIVSMLGSTKRSHVRASRDDLINLAKETETYKALASLTHIARCQGKTELELVLQPEHEDRRTADTRWPPNIVEGFDIDGSTYKVTVI